MRHLIQVGTNLIAGRVRLVFVAGVIPPELRRIVEFLNAQMNPADMIGVEVQQYGGAEGTRTLVPRVIGRTADAERAKGGGGPGPSTVGTGMPSAPRPPGPLEWIARLQGSLAASPCPSAFPRSGAGRL